MNEKELNTEQLILEAAQAEFFEKGYAGAKTVSIARRAGISHSMLHYYFRTKENLFQRIFAQKIQTLTQIFTGIYEQHLSFEELLRKFIEAQFNFAAQNPQLPHFVMNEILSNRNNRKLVFDVFAPKMSVIFDNLERMLNIEIEAGRIRPITLIHLVMNVVAMNVFIFVAMPLLEEILPLQEPAVREKILDERRESNVQFVLNALRA
ncbi:MAG: TetR/AcrR family transcriptional regulator [Tannerellaceae bacterium]|jgi:AcrR family transcriptional regulator|nr:TetR/AcrR family transcriptional regulator [Tannerellaceae bacterium]